MIDSTVVAFGYAFLAFAGLVSAFAVAGIALALRELRSTPAEVVVTVAGPQRELSRVA
ncbi:hypothetical protein [Nocardioides sp. YIM 152315]|uniref:hypothetical protein n=1 Tax=Nocardioides sp. YIM 152315 TaxID=3031760 RepID=UPI0023DA6E59|nr:hypothetical protein [Nocardioides sp. YIM 152315]MDF1606231.1 hypothetical protein [Nocardioides sp. YIM 152315]